MNAINLLGILLLLLVSCTPAGVQEKTQMNVQALSANEYPLGENEKEFIVLITEDGFDPETIRDVATFDNPNQLSDGMRFVLVNGVPVIEEGKMTNALPGKVLRGPGYRP